MSNYFPHENSDIFDLKYAIEIFEDEEMIKMQLPMFLENYQDGKGFDQLITLYKKGGWDIFPSKEYTDFEMLAHTLKGQCRYVGFHRLQIKLEKLQFSIRDGQIIQVGPILDESLEQAQLVQKAILKYLEQPDDQIKIYKSVTPFYERQGNIQVNHKLDYFFHKDIQQLSQITQYQPYQPQLINDSDTCQLI